MKKEVTRSMKFKLLPTNRKQEKLEELSKEFARLSNFVVEKTLADFDGKNYSKIDMLKKFARKDSKYDLLEKSDILRVRRHAESIVEKVHQNLKDYIRNGKYEKNKFSQPNYDPYIHFSSRLTRFKKTKKGYWILQLSMQHDLMYVKIFENESNTKMINKLKESEGEREWSCEIFKKNGDWFISPHYKMKVPEPPNEGEIKYFIGIDRNIRHPAVVTVLNRDKEVEQVEFIDNNNLQDRRQNLHQRISELQEKGEKNLTNKLKRKDGNIAKTGNHKISRKIVDIAEKYKPCVIIFENLKYADKSLKIDNYNETGKIKGKNGRFYNKIIHYWSPQMLSKFTEYKAEEKGIDTIYINPKNTSQTCPECGKMSENSRKKHRHIFECNFCGYQANDDYIASRNIAKRGIKKVSI